MRSPGSNIIRISSRVLIFLSLLITLNDIALAQISAPSGSTHRRPSGSSAPVLRGTFESAVNTPGNNLSRRGTISVKGDKVTLLTQGGNTLTGRLTAVRTGTYTAVAMTLTKPVTGLPSTGPNRQTETLSLKLQPIKGGVQLTNAEGESTYFRTILKCPDPPACKESALCRPFCVMIGLRRASAKRSN
jgi:hypothetical protein